MSVGGIVVRYSYPILIVQADMRTPVLWWLLQMCIVGRLWQIIYCHCFLLLFLLRMQNYSSQAPLWFWNTPVSVLSAPLVSICEMRLFWDIGCIASWTFYMVWYWLDHGWIYSIWSWYYCCSIDYFWWSNWFKGKVNWICRISLGSHSFSDSLWIHN